MSQVCPKCGSEMRKRNGKFGEFYGCVNFPKCKGTRQVSKSVNKTMFSQEPIRELKRIENPSKYQKSIFEAVLDKSFGNIIVSAGAGSGKTTTIEHIVGLLKDAGYTDIVYAVFNAHVRDSAAKKGLPAMTTHQMGLAAITAYNKKRPEIKGNKVNTIVKNLIQETWDEDKWLVSLVCDMVSKLKNTLAPTDDDTLAKIADKFGIELNGSSEKIFQMVRLALEESNKNLNVIDFDDMIYLPYKYKMSVKQYDWVLGDEIQDWNRAQHQLILKSVKETGRIVGVGDTFQSMYGFRGAAIDSMDMFKEATNATELPLSISYRCAKSHVKLVNALFPEIPFEQFDENSDGYIGEMSTNRMLGMVKDGDLVLCRTNAPLVKPVFSLIRMGVKAIIRGRDIGTGLISIIEKMNADTLDNLIDKLVEYRRIEVSKLLKAEKNNQASSLDDKIETILQIALDCREVNQVIIRINEIFSDKNEGVVFSTVHRAKGDEANRVFILEPQLMPHKMATKDWEVQQERNVMYVALTRAKKELYFVDGSVPAVFMADEMWQDVEEEVTEYEKIKNDWENLEDEINEVMTDEVIEQITERMDIEKVWTNVEINPITEEVKFDKVIEVKEVPDCPF